ncbi:ATP-grasp domain-containing protein [Mesorhizobium kowhaii]|uniref:ATP-grasp domain-containing protein n=1 Tax=Mesorhizobium kowhaii TaxID=1300272 RepID=A0A2W7BWJ3_9HYPH|nr:ATP-grasp domain-containing protein [Mesorhizobium kowhaii]PZV35072.1 ATP-grasp domain-containing protein [Mesorhizobium kowhaii]
MLSQLKMDDRVSSRPAGVVILGGAHGTLALARSLGAQKVPVWLISADTPFPRFSRYAHRQMTWPGPEDDGAVAFLLKLAETQGLDGFLLIPGGDPEVRFVSQAIEQLSDVFDVVLPPWQQLKWVCEKPLLYRRARELALAIPLTFEFTSLEQARAAELRFPVILKPNMGGRSRFARAKAILTNDQASFLTAYKWAAEEIGFENVVVQEMIPGGGESQFSYAALWNRGAPVAEFTARRSRQYPVDFGYTSTFVEVVDEPQLIDAARRLLGSIAHHGLVEVEFKRDRRDGSLKILDVNPRPWTWFGLAAAAGVDLGAMLWAIKSGHEVGAVSARPNTSWMYLVRDMVAVSKLISSGRLTKRAYLRSFGSVRAWATFTASDPMPGLIDIPLTVWRVLTRRILRTR